jgi:hypothetical protein
MKVFVAMGGYDYEDSYVLGVYSTREKANQAIERDKADNCMDWYDVTEWTIDAD